MNRTPVTGIAPQIFRKRLLVEGYFSREVGEEVIEAYFDRITDELERSWSRASTSPCG